MYADRYARPEGIKTGSLSIAVAINGALIAALLFSAPAVVAVKDKILEVRNIPVDPRPEPAPPKTAPQPRQKSLVSPQLPDPIIKTAVAPEAPFSPPAPLPIPFEGKLPGAAEILPTPAVPHIFTDARVDPGYVGALQPDYPAGERRAEHEGKVVIRVLIGIDGRVKQAERISAENDQFWRATEQRALTKWRFRPATRDGVPVETWRTMTVRFQLET